MRYQQAMQQLGTSQRTMETLTKALPAADSGGQLLTTPLLVAVRKEKALNDEGIYGCPRPPFGEKRESGVVRIATVG